MDRTQYGRDQTLIYTPYDIVCKKKPAPGYTLLADLQNTIKPRDGVGVTVSERLEGHSPLYPPSSATPPHYEYEGGAPPTSPRNYNHHLNGSASHSPHSVNDHEQVFQQQEVVEVVRSSDQRGQAKLSSVNNNLSELDTLLQDLNNARYTNYSKGGEGTGPTANGVIRGRPTVDSLLDELNSVGTSEVVEKRTVHYEVRNTTHSMDSTSSGGGGGGEGGGGGGVAAEGALVLEDGIGHGTPTASSATKELDDLMASLSDFKGVQKNTSQVTTTVKTEGLVAQELKGSEVPPRPPSPEEARPPPRPSGPYVSDGESSDGVYARPLSARTPIEGCSSSSLPSTPLPGPQIPAVPPRVGQPINREDPWPEGGPVRRNDAEYRWVFDERPPEDPYIRPQSGGPVKRHDMAYRWVTDEREPDMEFPCVSERINASNLQSQVQVNDSAYAKPHKPLKSTPPPQPPQPQQSPQPSQPSQPSQPTPPPSAKEPTPTPSPTPTPTPPVPKQANQLDSMLGSLASHMTEQGVTTTQKGCCCACDKPIVGQVITALGKTWHPEHFSCAHCNQELGTRNFFEREGRPYCEQDYHNLFSPRCAYCNGPILDKCVTALNTTWHPEHFFCAHCGNTFGEEGFHEKDGKPYCRDDYFNMFAPKCGGCNSPIMDNYISALNAQWHPECFVCRDCKQNMNKKQYYDVDGVPVCCACLGVSEDEEEEEEDK